MEARRGRGRGQQQQRRQQAFVEDVEDDEYETQDQNVSQQAVPNPANLQQAPYPIQRPNRFPFVDPFVNAGQNGMPYSSPFQRGRNSRSAGNQARAFGDPQQQPGGGLFPAAPNRYVGWQGRRRGAGLRRPGGFPAPPMWQQNGAATGEAMIPPGRQGLGIIPGQMWPQNGAEMGGGTMTPTRPSMGPQVPLDQEQPEEQFDQGQTTGPLGQGQLAGSMPRGRGIWRQNGQYGLYGAGTGQILRRGEGRGRGRGRGRVGPNPWQLLIAEVEARPPDEPMALTRGEAMYGIPSGVDTSQHPTNGQLALSLRRMEATPRGPGLNWDRVNRRGRWDVGEALEAVCVIS